MATFSSSATAKSVGQFFYVSQPYMDLAGNGIVVTASRVIPVYKDSAAVLCLDFKFGASKSLSDTILATIPGDQAFRPAGEDGCPLIKR